jgi:hypothetical protein
MIYIAYLELLVLSSKVIYEGMRKNVCMETSWIATAWED